ncbi:MAG: hypothetical protein IJD48_03835 [Clostridia bacterium]|nr:hypothetical protein [Clostridia bacterium]
MTYQQLVQKIVDLQDEGLELFNIGKSTLGKNILATHLGSYQGTQIVIQGGIHAREYISTLLMVEQAKYLHKKGGITNGGIYFVFLTNPDGVEIVLDGIKNLPCDITKQYLILANKGEDFSQFKANVNLVDLNTNFDADWGSGDQNTKCPNPQNFIGFYPNSEREVNNLINFTNKNKPALTISYHSKGEVIYYGFKGQSVESLARDRYIGEQLSNLTGYPLLLTENSAGGYKDWCIRYLNIPSYTIEIGNEDLTHPIGEEFLPQIFEKNKDVPLLALNLARQYQNSLYAQNYKKNKIPFINLFKIFNHKK